ncbi:unnamed protein product [Prunus armeniaca]
MKQATMVSQALTSCPAIENNLVINFQKKDMIRLDLSHNDAFIINIQIAQVVIDRIHVDECSTPISCNFRLSSKWAVGPS